MQKTEFQKAFKNDIGEKKLEFLEVTQIENRYQQK